MTFIRNIMIIHACLFVFVCLGISSHSRIFHTFGDVTITGEGRATNFDLYSALMAIEQWGFFSVPHLLWHGLSVYNGHLRGPVTLTHTPIAEHLAMELSLPVFTTCVCRGWDSNNHPYACTANVFTHCATAAALLWITCITKNLFKCDYRDLNFKY